MCVCLCVHACVCVAEKGFLVAGAGFKSIFFSCVFVMFKVPFLSHLLP